MIIILIDKLPERLDSEITRRIEGRQSLPTLERYHLHRRHFTERSMDRPARFMTLETDVGLRDDPTVSLLVKEPR